MTERIDEYLSQRERDLLNCLTGPQAIQAYLDSIRYSLEDRTRCPVDVMHDKCCHCYDGGLFAAMVLRRLGYPARVMVLLPEWGADDDHMIAIYKRNGRYGAIAKSAFVGLRSREPLYHTPRELAMSYMHDYFTPKRQRTMRGYTSILDLAPFDRYEWECSQEGTNRIIDHLPKLRQFITVTPEMVAELPPVDDLTYRAGMLVWDFDIQLPAPAGMPA